MELLISRINIVTSGNVIADIKNEMNILTSTNWIVDIKKEYTENE